MAIVLGLVAAAVAGWALMRSGEETTARTITATASLGEASRTVSASGTLEPAQSEAMGFAVSGTVTAVLVDLGDQVTKDQPLARISTELVDAQLEAAQSTVAAAQDELDSAQDDDSSVMLSAANAQLVTAEDDLRAAREAVESAVLRAPFDGQVVSLDLDVGDVVGTGAGGSGIASSATSGKDATTGGSEGASETSGGTINVASVDRFVVETTVSSSDLKSVKKGLQVQITAAEVEEMLYGTVSEVGRVATTTSSGGAAFPVTVELTGDVEGVYGGTSVTVSIVVEKRLDVLTVPTQALRSEDGRTYVELVGPEGETIQRDVQVGETFGESTEILDGLSEGEQIEIMSLPGGGGDRTGGGEFPGGGGGGGRGGGGQLSPGGTFPGGAP